MIKCLCLSDLHGYLPTDLIPHHLLLISGDLCPFDKEHDAEWYLNIFIPWIKDCNEKYNNHVVFIAGNHDFFFESNENDVNRFLLELEKLDATYLQDDSVVFEGIKIYGTPWNSNLPTWAFCAPERALWGQWRTSIPYTTDIILSHTPPYTVRDAVRSNIYSGFINVGNKSLYNIAVDLRPKYIVCGHIHEGYGIEKLNPYTTVVNCSLMNERYEPVNQPILLELNNEVN